MSETPALDFEPSHDHNRCVDDALSRAERLCRERGLRLTPVRRRVLEVLWRGHAAVKAYDILRELSGPGGSVKPPTVYRALDFLMGQGLAHRVDSLSAYVGCPHPERRHACQLLMCRNCGLVVELEAPEVTNRLQAAARACGFAPEDQSVEVHGLCATCRANPPDAVAPSRERQG